MNAFRSDFHENCHLSEAYNQISFWFIIVVFSFSFHVNAQVFVNVESGILFTNLNDIRNGTNGTLLSLKNDLTTPANPFVRIRAGFLLNEKHHFSILYAPLKTSVFGTLDRDILYDEKNFKSSIPLEVIYKFNSYRFTYNRRVISKDNFRFGLGLSLKVRDAGIALKNQNQESENFGIGFVPLINLLVDWYISKRFAIDFLGEGLVAKKGRALDLALSGRYRFTDNLDGKMGYRLLEGGVDGALRYNFVQLHYAFLSFNYSFEKKNKSSKSRSEP